MPLIARRVRGRRIVGLWYGLEDGYLRIELDDGAVLVVAASWEGAHVYVDVASFDEVLSSPHLTLLIAPSRNRL